MMGVNITESSVGQCSPGQADLVATLIVGLVASLHITITALFLKVTIGFKVRRQKTFDENSRFVNIFSE